ncbi:hypothetical protein AVEN_110814-1 [Araneus ventricosus]|uniref:ISXO2-like transposase domain-containing protein n=1 Tax=Araneus ventricosus TaxID=182803 RepID=A0A4Y2GH60_ARAVE|nr:hypothetical protein AVEN_110814-1 [Araneus ventricosus]
MAKREREEEKMAKETGRENDYSSARKTVISDNIGSVETYYQLKTADAKVVLQWCMDQGLIASGYQCPKCKQPMVLTPRADNCDKFTWVCRIRGQNAHHVKRSVRTGSWFERSRLPIPTILLFLIYWCLEMKTKFILEQLDITNKTAIDWTSFCREVCLDILICQSDKIGGPGVVVEIYESQCGERKFHQGKKAVGEWIFCGVERGTTNCFFAVVENRTSEVLLSVIEKHILPGTTIISDCWKSYDCLFDESFKHLTVNLSMHFVDPNTATHKSSIEGMWSNIKRNLQSTNHVQGQFDSYLAAYMWRRKNSSAESRMRSLIEIIKEGYPLRTKDVLSSSRKKNGKQLNCSTNSKQDALSSLRKKNGKRLKCSRNAEQDAPSLSREEDS